MGAVARSQQDVPTLPGEPVKKNFEAKYEWDFDE
jgi:hypothetical protein